MKKQVFLLVIVIHFFVGSAAQEIVKDTTLQEIIIQAYTAGRPLNEVPASIGIVSSSDLVRFSNTSLLPAVNAVPGVRMEERSPGSYRFSIRGSLLRSPFGVRNVKVYWNGLPLTDGGGNTYLNLVDFNSIGNMEIIKGPGGSLYGAGTGGVVLLSSPQVKKDKIEISAVGGSYGLQRYQVGGQVNGKKQSIRIQYAHQKSNGYREQTEMRRDALNADLKFLIGSKSTLSATIFYTDLFYETPGALTEAQFNSNPKQARQAGGPNRGAVEQKAAVYNKTPYGGLTYNYDWNDAWSTRVGIFASRSAFKNPSIRNYEERTESNDGARTETQYKFGKVGANNKLTFGGEHQNFSSPIRVYGNSYGVQDTIQTYDGLSARSSLIFAQTEFQLPAGFFLTAGGSLNFLSYYFTRFQPSGANQSRDFNTFFSPRVALLKKFSENVSVYGNVSRGFSPPSLAEVRPSTNTFSSTLKAETGTNYEMGFRGQIVQQLSFDVTTYYFKLNETIVPRHQSDGAEYFINAGKTDQKGIEAKITWSPIQDAAGFVSDLKIWNSYTYNHYRFNNYASDAEDFTGNKLTGIPPTVNFSAVDITIREKLYLNVTANYVDHVPLTDANTFFANEYFLLGARLGYKTIISKNTLEIFTGVDNALDKQYSLGNDLNAKGSRFYNAAPARNFYFGLKMDVNFK